MEIRRFCQFSYLNVGIATGKVSGLCVVDIDAKNGGVESLQRLEKEYGPLPKTVVATTGHDGGAHHYFLYPVEGIKCKTNLLPGIDIRGDGGFVVAPPSIHKSGKIYSWKESCGPDDVALAEMPELFLQLINNQYSKKGSDNNENGTWNEGSRNDNLFRIACALRSRGLGGNELVAALLEENRFRCCPPLPVDEVRNIAKSAERYPPGGPFEDFMWQVLRPLPPLEVEVPSLPDELIPEALRPWVLDVAERMQSSNEMLMAPTIIVFSGLIGRRLAIKPKMKDDWKVIPNLWGGIVAPPSAMKTPVMNEVLRQVRRLEAVSKEKYLSELALFNKRCEEDKNYGGPKPVRKRRVTNDSTIEKLGELLSQNPNGLIAFRDELYGFLMAMEKPGRESDRQFYLEAFNGDGAFTSDRIGRGTIDVPALCVSILGGIQPDRISSYFAETVKNGSSDDGFMSRFQVLVYPPRSTEWQLIDRYPNAGARDRAFAIFTRVDEMDFIGHGYDQGQYDEMPIARFNPRAQELFYEWLKKLECRLRSGEIESPAFEAHLAKYKKLMPSLALIFHVIEFCDPERKGESQIHVGLQSAQMAAAWCDFLEAHAKKIYADALRPQVTSAHALAKKIHSGEITDRMTVRSIYRKEWAQLRDSKLVRTGLSLLETHHWIRIIEESPTGKGAPSEVIYLNPELGLGGSK